MTNKLLPIGVQNFATIRSENDYVDKTPLIWELADCGHYYFFARPRGFGKSLLMDTIAALFAEQESLFEGLDVHDHWDWSVTYPVLRLSFEGKYNDLGEIEEDFLAQLKIVREEYGLASSDIANTSPLRLRNILGQLQQKTGRQVVILVDDYDKPLLGVLQDPALAAASRDYRLGFYGMIKHSSEHVRFALLSGIAMFPRAGIFSGLNNLLDISLSPRSAAICGFTDADLVTVFDPELEGLDRELIRTGYNGYNWRGNEPIYNLVDILHLFKNRDFSPYWFETGSSTLLAQTLVRESKGPLTLDGCLVSESLISRLDVEDLGTEVLFFQTGHLTITKEIDEFFSTIYRLDYPNQAVRFSFNAELLSYLYPKRKVPTNDGETLRARLETNDFERFAEILKAYLGSIPFQWEATDELSRHRAWYSSLLYLCFGAIGMEVRGTQKSSNRDHANIVVRTGGQVFVLQFEVIEDATASAAALETAFTQMRGQGNADAYHGQPVHLIAVAWGREAHNLLQVRAEQIIRS